MELLGGDAYADDGMPLPLGGRIILRLSQAIQVPLISGLSKVDYFQQALPSYFMIIILFLNSLLWGLVPLGIAMMVTRNRQQGAGTAATGDKI